MDEVVIEFERIDCPIHAQYPAHECPCEDKPVYMTEVIDLDEEPEPDYEAIWEARMEAKYERMMDRLDRLY